MTRAVPVAELELHPDADKVPEMQPDEYVEFAKDIAARRGLRLDHVLARPSSSGVPRVRPSV